MRAMLFLLLSLACFFVFACSSAEAPGLPEGRCKMNTDCPDGFRCNDKGYCEDIYYPRKDIKPY